MALDRTWYNALVNDSGDNLSGTLVNKAFIDAIYDDVDAALALLLPLAGGAMTGTISGSVAWNAGAVTSSGIIDASQEFRMVSSFTRVAIRDSAGAWFGGYNVKGNAVPSTQPQHDSTGASSAIYLSASGFDVITDVSQVAGTSLAAKTQLRIDTAGLLRLYAYTATTFAAGDKYLVVDASGNVHRSAIGPAS